MYVFSNTHIHMQVLDPDTLVPIHIYDIGVCMYVHTHTHTHTHTQVLDPDTLAKVPADGETLGEVMM